VDNGKYGILGKPSAIHYSLSTLHYKNTTLPETSLQAGHYYVWDGISNYPIIL